MFKLADAPCFTREVTVRVPCDGGHRNETFKATFLAISVTEAQSYDLATFEGTTRFLEAVIFDLSDIADEQGKPLPYNHALRTRLIDLPWTRSALAAAYFEALGAARLGN